MVRTKKVPEKVPKPGLIVQDIVGKLILHCAAEHYQNMVLNKCHTCEDTVNKIGDKKPGIHCKQCKNEYCNKCAGLTVEQCEMMRSWEKGFWSCKECETKKDDLKAVLASMNSIKTELSTIKEGQAEVVEAVTRRLDRIEDVQEKQEQRLSSNEEAIKENAKKVEEGEKRTSTIEKKLEMISSDALNVKQINAVVRELRDIENTRRNLVICNLPESTNEDPNVRKKDDEKKVDEVFKQLKAENVKPRNLIRVGHRGRYPKKLLVILNSESDNEKILVKAEETTLPNDVWLSRDRTFNQREGARLFHAEKKEREETDAAPSRGKGPGRPKKTGSVRGGRQDGSRKRQHSGDDDDAKWRRTEGRGAGRGSNRGRGTSKGRGRGGAPTPLENAATAEDEAGSRPHLPSLPAPRKNPAKEGKEGKKATESKKAAEAASEVDRPETTPPISDAELGAAGGSDNNF